MLQQEYNFNLYMRRETIYLWFEPLSCSEFYAKQREPFSLQRDDVCNVEWWNNLGASVTNVAGDMGQV